MGGFVGSFFQFVHPTHKKQLTWLWFLQVALDILGIFHRFIPHWSKSYKVHVVSQPYSNFSFVSGQPHSTYLHWLAAASRGFGSENCEHWKWKDSWVLPITTVWSCCSSSPWARWALPSMNTGPTSPVTLSHPHKCTSPPKDRQMFPKSSCASQGRRENTTKAEWRCFTAASGARCATTTSPSTLRTWSAGSWAMWKRCLGYRARSMEKEKVIPERWYCANSNPQ